MPAALIACALLEKPLTIDAPDPDLPVRRLRIQFMKRFALSDTMPCELWKIAAATDWPTSMRAAPACSAAGAGLEGRGSRCAWDN